MGETLSVVEIFESLQGEGLWAGTPMTFIRLAGCNAPEQGLACVRWCDTPEALEPSAGRLMEVDQITDAVRLPRVCLTGGEPLLQGSVAPLTALLRERGRLVHLETNGTVAAPAGAVFDWVTVSPKPPDFRVAESFRPAGSRDAAALDGVSVDEVKLVVDDVLTVQVAEGLAARFPGAVVSIQPEWRGGEPDVRRAMDLVLSHPEWRLSLQLHKLIGVP